MKTVISLHSFVDLITNSSSELFICDTKKSVASVKEIIEALAKLYNKKFDLAEKETYYGPISIHGLWTDVFSEPHAAEYDFNLKEFPRYAEWREMFDNRNSGYWSSDGSQLHPVEREAQHAFEDWKRDNKTPAPKWKENMTAKEKKQHDADYRVYRDIEDAASDRCYKKWNAMVLDIYTGLFKWVGERNKIDLSLLGKLEVHGGRYCNAYFTGMVGENYGKYGKGKKLKAAKFVDEINDAISWGYTFKKGDVFLHSASDNTIPDIEATFNCQRRHLG
jgi:hypothetical protein